MSTEHDNAKDLECKLNIQNLVEQRLNIDKLLLEWAKGINSPDYIYVTKNHTYSQKEIIRGKLIVDLDENGNLVGIEII